MRVNRCAVTGLLLVALMVAGSYNFRSTKIQASANFRGALQSFTAGKFFNGEMPYLLDVHGTSNGKSFKVAGKGLFDANHGTSKGQLICKSGELPIAWEALAAVLPIDKLSTRLNGITTFLQNTMPDGFTEESLTTFPGGQLKSHAEVDLGKACMMLKVDVVAEFPETHSPVLTKGLNTVHPSEGAVAVFEDGLATNTTLKFPTKDGSGVVSAEQRAVNRPVGSGEMGAGPFVLKRSMTLTKDMDDASDSIILETNCEAKAH